MASELCKRGLMGSESMSWYIKQAVKEKLEADGVVVGRYNQQPQAQWLLDAGK